MSDSVTFIRSTPALHIILDIRYHLSREHDTACDNGQLVTASLLTALVMGDLPRLLYPLTFFSLRQVGGREPGSSKDVTLPLIPDEDREKCCMKGFCQKSVSQWGPIQKSQGHFRWHQVGDWEWETQHVCVYHTMPMVRTLSSCWQVVTSYPAPPPGQLPLG